MDVRRTRAAALMEDLELQAREASEKAASDANWVLKQAGNC